MKSNENTQAIEASISRSMSDTIIEVVDDISAKTQSNNSTSKVLQSRLDELQTITPYSLLAAKL